MFHGASQTTPCHYRGSPCKSQINWSRYWSGIVVIGVFVHPFAVLIPDFECRALHLMPALVCFRRSSHLYPSMNHQLIFSTSSSFSSFSFPPACAFSTISILSYLQSQLEQWHPPLSLLPRSAPLTGTMSGSKSVTVSATPPCISLAKNSKLPH